MRGEPRFLALYADPAERTSDAAFGAERRYIRWRRRCTLRFRDMVAQNGERFYAERTKSRTTWRLARDRHTTRTRVIWSRVRIEMNNKIRITERGNCTAALNEDGKNLETVTPGGHRYLIWRPSQLKHQT